MVAMVAGSLKMLKFCTKLVALFTAAVKFKVKGFNIFILSIIQ